MGLTSAPFFGDVKAKTLAEDDPTVIIGLKLSEIKVWPAISSHRRRNRRWQSFTPSFSRHAQKEGMLHFVAKFSSLDVGLENFDKMGRKRFDYALALLGHLKEQGGDFAAVGEIARTHGLPAAYLEKVAQELKRAGWLEARKGPGGGYRIKGGSTPVSVEALINFYNPMYELCPVLRALKK